MKRRNFLKKSVLATAGLAISPSLIARYAREPFLDKRVDSLSPVAKDIKVLVLEGPARKRGQIYGEALKPKILELIKLWKDSLHKLRGMNPDKYIDQFVEETNFLPSIKKWTPDLLEEVKGIGEGAGLDFKTIYAFKLLDEEWWYGREIRLSNAGPQAHHCSSLGVFKQGKIPSMVAQTVDISPYYDGFQVLLHIKYPSSSLESLVFTYAGLIVLIGMNNQSLGIGCNTVLQLNYSKDGLPVAFVVREFLEQSTPDDAIKFMHNIKHASGQNYLIGGPEKVVSFECSANKVSQFIPYKGANRVYHTNHPLVNDDQSMYREMKLPPYKNSEIRFNSLRSQLKDTSKKVNVETIKSILGSHDHSEHPICRHKKPGRGMTIAGLIMVLSSSPEIYVAPGPPCSTEFKIYKFGSS